jgi:sugar phosphate permease
MPADPDNARFSPRNWPFFYGWMILLAGTVGVLASAPGQTNGVSPFTESLINALGLSRVDLSLAYMFGTIGSALLLTRAGKLYDRYGARRVATAAAVVLALALLALSACDQIAAAVNAWLPHLGARRSSLVVATLGFFALRFSGQGVLTMVSLNMMMKWFDRHRGLVTAITGMFIAPGFSAAPLVLSKVVTAVGWRETWQMTAVLIGVGFSLFAWLFFRESAEACGLVADGPWRDRSLGARKPGAGPRHQFTLAEARRCPTFWIFSLGLSLFGFVMTGFTFHVASIFETAGLEAAAGFAIFLPGAIISVILRPLVGWLADRIPLKYLMMAMLIALIMVATTLSVLGPRWTLVLLVVGNGVCFSMMGTLYAITWPNFFGRTHLGAISGFNSALCVFFSALAPWMFGQCLAATGSYAGIEVACAGVAAVLVVFSTRADDPQGEGGRTREEGKK